MAVPAALVHSVFGGKGTYVPLIASGVSRAAGILTGHDVTMEFVGRIALIETLSRDVLLKYGTACSRRAAPLAPGKRLRWTVIRRRAL